MLIQQPLKMEDHSKELDTLSGERQTSFRRRKNGAFLRPNLIDVVGLPKHKPSDANKSDDENEEENFISQHGEVSVQQRSTTELSIEPDGDEKTIKDGCRSENNKSREDYVKELDNLTNLLRSLIIKEFEVSPDENLNTNVERNSNESTKYPELTRKRSQSEKEFRSRCAIEWEEEADHVMLQLPLTPQKEKRCWRESDTAAKSVSRTHSLPETKRSKSKFAGLLSFGRGRHSNGSNQVYVSSDGEGSGQSYMSFASTSSLSSHGRRSRSGSFLSRTRTCSSPMSDKRSRAGSLINNRTGCPQYFIPGENRGRVFMEPLDLFQTKTVCIKGVSFRILKDMPRTHRAMSMIGCMGFIVPAPSKYFER